MKVSESLGEECDSLADVACLTDFRGQLERKKDILIKLDSSVAEHIDDESNLIAKVCETEDIQASISKNISQINGFLERQLPTASVTTSDP